MVFIITGTNAYSEDQSFVELKIGNFVKKIYNDDDDFRIKLGNIPTPLKGTPNVKNISFAKVPDAKGDGVCLVEIEGKNNRDRSVYVPFRVIRKTKVFILTNSGKKGDVLRTESVSARETHFNEKKPGYPSKLDDIAGRTLKKDTAAGTVITYSIIDDPVVIQKGEVVNIVAENKKLKVQTRGKALEKGRMGDSIRVKNISSDREIVGKVVSGNTILVSF
jgi:flagella basal body P-ring formation protein FlgA